MPPQLDGIGDYTACLAAEVAKSETVTVLTGAKNPDPIPGVRTQTAFSPHTPASVRQIVRIVEEDKPDWVLLQYNPFSYGRWGLNLHLPEMLRRLRRVSPETRIAVMVHEPFVPIISLKFAVMGAYQRWQLWRIGQTANIMFFSIEAWQLRFQNWFPGKPLVHLPVGSNIPLIPCTRAEARARLGIEDRNIVLGLFGTASAGRLLEWVGQAAKAVEQSGRSVQLLYIGPDTEKFRAAAQEIPLIAGGKASTEEVSLRFTAMDVFLRVNQPVTRFNSDKRSSAILLHTNSRK